MTLVDTETGEIVHSLALAIPRPQEVADVYDLCTLVEDRLPDVDDVGDICEAKAKFVGLDAYLAQMSKDGRARVLTTTRRIEVRIGELLGEGEHGGDRKSDQVRRGGLDLPLSKHERSEFRLMAANEDVVEAVISESTDLAPPSRKKVLNAIRVHQKTIDKETNMQRLASGDRADQIRAGVEQGMDVGEIANAVGLSTTRVGAVAKEHGVVLGKNTVLAVRQRVETARRMAAEGYTSSQIATAIGLAPGSMHDFRTRHGVTVPADAVVGAQPKIDSNRIVNATVESVLNVDSGMNHIDYTTLDGARLQGWIDSLDAAISSLTNLRKNIKKEQSSRD